MSLYFSGFTPAALQFLEDLAKNNTREWFAEHKPDYEHLLKNPSLGLVDVMNERFEDLGLAFVSTPKASLFRIHRDTRFSKDKSPYKTNCGISFPYHARRQDGTAVNSPGLYLHIAPQELFVAGGASDGGRGDADDTAAKFGGGLNAAVYAPPMELRVANDPALFYLIFVDLKLWLDQRDNGSLAGANRSAQRRQDQGLRDKRDITYREIWNKGQLRRVQGASVDAV
mgnify:CR=1 FL=1